MSKRLQHYLFPAMILQNLLKLPIKAMSRGIDPLNLLFVKSKTSGGIVDNTVSEHSRLEEICLC